MNEALSRRRMSRSSAIAGAGVAGAALIGRNSDDDPPAATGTPSSVAGAVDVYILEASSSHPMYQTQAWIDA